MILSNIIFLTKINKILGYTFNLKYILLLEHSRVTKISQRTHFQNFETETTRIYNVQENYNQRVKSRTGFEHL